MKLATLVLFAVILLGCAPEYQGQVKHPRTSPVAGVGDLVFVPIKGQGGIIQNVEFNGTQWEYSVQLGEEKNFEFYDVEVLRRIDWDVIRDLDQTSKKYAGFDVYKYNDNYEPAPPAPPPADPSAGTLVPRTYVHSLYPSIYSYPYGVSAYLAGNSYVQHEGQKIYFCPSCRRSFPVPETSTDVNCLQEESKTLPPLTDLQEQQQQYLRENGIPHHPITPPTPPPPTEDQRKKMDSLRQQIEEQVNKVPAA